MQCDILVIGSGAAGLTLALRSAAQAKVTVLSKGQLNEGATYYAQGGIAAVLAADDSLASHVQDTLTAGVGLGRREVVEYIVSRSTEVVSWLLDQGVPFTTATRVPDAGTAASADAAAAPATRTDCQAGPAQSPASYQRRGAQSPPYYPCNRCHWQGHL